MVESLHLLCLFFELAGKRENSTTGGLAALPGDFLCRGGNGAAHCQCRSNPAQLRVALGGDFLHSIDNGLFPDGDILEAGGVMMTHGL